MCINFFLFFFKGITNFDLLGDFGRIEWLGNFYIVLFYNVVFAVAIAVSLVTTFTTTIRRELYSCLSFLSVYMLSKQRTSISFSDSNLGIKND